VFGLKKLEDRRSGCFLFAGFKSFMKDSFAEDCPEGSSVRRKSGCHEMLLHGTKNSL